MRKKTISMLFQLLISFLVISCAPPGKEIISSGNFERYDRTYTVQEGKDFLNKAINYHYRKDDKLQAIRFALKAKIAFEKNSDLKMLAATLHELGMLYREIGQFSLSIKYNEQGIIIDRKTGNLKDLNGKLGNLAISYSDIGDFSKSQNYFIEAINLSEKLNDKKQLCVNYFNLAYLCRNYGLYEKAISYYSEINNIMNNNMKLQKDSLVTEFGVITGLFRTYLLAGDLDKAKTYLQRINKLKYLPLESGLYALYAENYNKAIREFKKVLSGEFSPYTPVSETSSRRGSFEWKLTLKPNTNPVKEHMTSLDDLFAANMGLGLAYERLDEWDDAFKYYSEIVSKGETQRDLLNSDQRKYFYSKKIVGFNIIQAYEGLSRVLFQKGKYNEAYMASETISSRLFAEDYARRVEEKIAIEQIPPDIKEKEERLNKMIFQIKQKELAKVKKDKDSIDYMYESKKNKSLGDLLTWGILKGAKNINNAIVDATSPDEIEELKKERSQLIAEVEAQKEQYKKYFAVKYPEPDELKNIQLNHGEVIVKYEVTVDGVLVWLIRDNDIVSCREIAISYNELQSMVNQYRQFFENVQALSDLNAFDVELSFRLYSILFKDIDELLGQADRVIIIPDEILSKISFSTLKTGIENEAHFLGEKYLLTYFQSVSALNLYRQLASEAKSNAGVLIVADPEYSMTTEISNTAYASANTEFTVSLMRAVEEGSGSSPVFNRLLKTRRMAEEIGAMFGTQARTLLGTNANEPALAQMDLGQYKYLIFATHGILKGQMGLIDEPSLVLTRLSEKPDEDGFLTAGEVLGLELNADLVSLTACHTGEGEMLRGEGVMGLFRSFQHAGAQNVLATLWAVSEDASTEFNKILFKRLRNGSDLTTAYSLSIQDLRRKGYDNPFYWGAFALYGI